MLGGLLIIADRGQRVGRSNPELQGAGQPFDDLSPDRGSLAGVPSRGLLRRRSAELVDLEVAALVVHRAIANALEGVELLPGFAGASLLQQRAAERVACVLSIRLHC